MVSNSRALLWGNPASLDKASGGCYGSDASRYALVAQLAEHIHGKDKVNGSIPFEGSTPVVSTLLRGK